ncbi:MAG TPA: NBR1-Ig-like domain-containing protein, partial [Polyangiales bacterium]|nr:NBR1-Ig-like domain-containing protein [Polyangiales bacterium]
AAEYVAQTFPLAAQPFELAPEQELAGYIELRNAGTQAWSPGATFLGTTEPRDGTSPLAAADWPSPSRAATVDHAVAPGEAGRFAFSVRAPSTPGEYPQFFNLVQENVAWFGDRGGPPDNQLQVRVTVVPGAEPEPEPPASDAGRDAGNDSARDSGNPEPDPDTEPDPNPDPDPDTDSDPDTDTDSDAGDGGRSDAAARSGDASASSVGWNAPDDGCRAVHGSRSASELATLLLGPALLLLRRKRRSR